MTNFINWPENNFPFTNSPRNRRQVEVVAVEVPKLGRLLQWRRRRQGLDKDKLSSERQHGQTLLSEPNEFTGASTLLSVDNKSFSPNN